MRRARPSACMLQARAAGSGLACLTVCSSLLCMDVGSTIKFKSSSHGYVRHHLHTTVYTEMCTSVFSHAIFSQKSLDGLVHVDNGRVNRHVGRVPKGRR